MSQSLLPWLSFYLGLPLALAACSEPGAPLLATTASLERRLAEEDLARKEWLAELVERSGEPARTEPARSPAACSTPRILPVPSVRSPDQVPDKVRLVTDGPLTSASYNAGSALFEGQQVQDGESWVRHGAWRAWHADGTPWEEGVYRAGEEDGPWRWWYEDGTPQAIGTFADGRHVGGWTYYHDTGFVLAEGVYDDDLPHGTWRTYHDTGALHSEGRFVRGEREGRWIVHDTEGFLDREASGIYRDGERVGE